MSFSFNEICIQTSVLYPVALNQRTRPFNPKCKPIQTQMLQMRWFVAISIFMSRSCELVSTSDKLGVAVFASMLTPSRIVPVKGFGWAHDVVSGVSPNPRYLLKSLTIHIRPDLLQQVYEEDPAQALVANAKTSGSVSACAGLGLAAVFLILHLPLWLLCTSGLTNFYFSPLLRLQWFPCAVANWLASL